MNNIFQYISRSFSAPGSSEKISTGERLLLLALLLSGVILLIYLSGILGPRYYWGNYSMFRHANLYCPACGGTRAIGLLFQGQLGLAWKHNQLFVLALPMIGYGGFSLIRSVIWGHPITGKHIKPYMVWGVLVIVVLFGVLRNIPLSAMDFLRPPY